MPKPLKLFTLAGAAILAAGTIVAQEQPSPAEAAHMSRERLMHLQAYHLGLLGPMAQGATEYDAELATEAATNLNNLAQLANADYLWPEGSSSEDLEDSRALPAIWENMDDFEAQAAAFQEATQNLVEQAGTDVESLQAAFGQVGQACGACHDTYRAAED